MKFEVETAHGRFEVDAPDMESAMSAIQSLGPPTPPESDTSKNLRSELSGITQSFGKDPTDSAGRNVDSFVRGAADLATFGMADEIAAGLGAATGIGGNFGDYSGNLRRQRITQEIRDQRDPIASNVGRVVGGVGTGIGLAKSGLTLAGKASGLGGKVAAGAAEGAAYGGAYGFGSGEGVGDRLAQAGGGAVAGAAIGAAVPVAAAATKAIAKPVVDAVRARINPGGYASQKVAERLSASNQTPASIATKLDANPGSAVADVGGKSARDLLRTAVNIPGPAKDRVAKQVTMRQFGQGDRLKSAIGRTFADPDGYLNAKEELASTARATAGPLYERAYARPVHYTEGLESILQTPAGQSALANAQKLAANEQQPFKQVFINIRGEAKRVPDTRGWDYIKRAMDDMIDSQTDPITRKVTNEGRILTNLKNRMLGEIDALNPDYKKARETFSSVAQIDNAMEFGRKALSMSPHAVRREITGMTPAQKEAARIGAAEELRKAIDATGYTHNAVFKVMGSRQRYQNLRALFDNDSQFAEFRKVVFQEARKRATYDAVKGNSTSVAQGLDFMEAGGLNEGVQFVGNAVKNGPVSATLQWVGSRLKMLGGFTPQVADEVAKRLMATSPDAARQMVAELSRIEAMKATAAQRSQLVQSLIAKALTGQAVAANVSSQPQ